MPRFVDLMVVVPVKIAVFLAVMPYGFVDVHQHFGWTHCLHLHGRRLCLSVPICFCYLHM